MWIYLLKALPWLAKIPSLSNIVGRFWKPAVGLMATLLIGLATWLYVDHLKDSLEDSQDMRKRLAAMLVEAQEANSDNLATIRALESANEQLRVAVTISDEIAREAAAEAVRRENESKARLESTLSELEELRNAEPSCEAIANLDIGAACPAAVERLRQLAGAAADRQD